METPVGVEDGFDSDSTVILESDNNEEMDIDDDITPDLIVIRPLNSVSPILPNFNQQENYVQEVPPSESESVLTRSSSPISLIANIGSPTVSILSDDTINNVPIAAVPDDTNCDDERSRSPILRCTQIGTLVSSQRPTNSEACEAKPSSSTIKKYEEDDGLTCPICFDSWTNLGEHRLCALKCGHLFGLSCILRWITTFKNKICPTCKEKASKKDIRYIYSKNLVAVDSTEIEEIKQKIQDTLEEKRKLQIELTKSVCREHLMLNELRELQNNINSINSPFKTNQVLDSDITVNRVKLYREKSLELCKAKGCRVLSYYEKNNLIVASTKSSNALFPGFGVRKIDLVTLKPTSYIPLHSGSIRDTRFHSEQPWLLSVSLDKTFKIVDTNSNTTVATQNSNNLPLWSCCWDTNDTNAFFVGEQQGSIVKFDVRHSNQPLDTYTVPGDHSPVVSIATMTASSKSPLEDGGIISCKLNSLWVFNNKASAECGRHYLPIDPSFICTTYDNTKSQMLISARPTSTVLHTRHYIANLVLEEPNNLMVNVSHCLRGSTTSKLLSRSCLLSHQGCSYAAAYQESDNMVCLWSTEGGQRVGTVSALNSVIDLCSVNVGNSTYLFSLTESKIDFYKFQ